MARKQGKRGLNGYVRDAKFYATWNRNHTWCQCCGRDQYRAERDHYPGLSTHHIIKSGRSDEATNLLRLCQRCHNLAEGIVTWRVPGQTCEKLTIGMCLWLKWKQDPLDYNPIRLELLRGSRLPDKEPPPDFLLQECEKYNPAIYLRLIE